MSCWVIWIVFGDICTPQSLNKTAWFLDPWLPFQWKRHRRSKWHVPFTWEIWPSVPARMGPGGVRGCWRKTKHKLNLEVSSMDATWCSSKGGSKEKKAGFFKCQEATRWFTTIVPSKGLAIYICLGAMPSYAPLWSCFCSSRLEKKQSSVCWRSSGAGLCTLLQVWQYQACHHGQGPELGKGFVGLAGERMIMGEG